MTSHHRSNSSECDFLLTFVYYPRFQSFNATNVLWHCIGQFSYYRSHITTATYIIDRDLTPVTIKDDCELLD